MLFLSQLLGRSVRLENGARLGRVADLLIPVGEIHPAVTHVVVRQKGMCRKLAWSHVTHVDEKGVRVDVPLDAVEPFAEGDPLLALGGHLLDRQIVDTDGRRVVRVNDLQLMRVGDYLRVVGVDVSTRGLLRRMGWEGMGDALARLFHTSLARSVIPWDYVESLDVREFSQIRLTISHQKLMGLHPADLAEIITDLHGPQRDTLFQSLNAETAAETLQELEEDVQVSLFKNLSDEQATSVLEEMDPDEAADLIAELPPERVAELLSRMEAEDAADVQELLSYEPDSAGGIMTTEYISLPNTLTAQQTIERLRELAPDAETIYYLYIVDEEERLLGVLSLRDLIVSPPETPSASFMIKNVICVQVDDSLDEVKDVMNKYDLLALPVVDANHVLRGIITVDDVMDRMQPSLWKRRFPRIF